MSQDGLGSLSFVQVVALDSVDAVFMATFKAATELPSGMGSLFGGTGSVLIGLFYGDENERLLGGTVLFAGDENVFSGTGLVGVPELPRSSNVEHRIQLEQGRLYNRFEIKLRTEIEQNVLGVDPEVVKTVAVGIRVGSTDKDAAAELRIADIEIRPNQ